MNNAIGKIHEFERFGSVLGLERMEILLDLLGNPQENLKVIHVAGTNGKGSICKYVYEVLQAEGYKTGLYTSPFLEVFNERIQFNGQYITDFDLERYTDIVLKKTEEMVAEGKESPTEFEVVTAIALLYFYEKKADYVVLEVGLGGRGDSTNVIKKPLLSMIASISLDHTDRLGNTIEKIAFEKAGIIKENCPVIIGTDRASAKKVFEDIAEERNAKLYDSTKVKYKVISESLGGTEFSLRILEEDFVVKISMLGEHQINNAVEALYGLVLLRQEEIIKISNNAVLKGFRKAKQIGRFEIMSSSPYVVIDGAHNPDGTLALQKAVEKYFYNKKILMVVGILEDKDVSSILNNFLKITDNFVVTEPNNPRKMDSKVLSEKIIQKGGKCIIMEEPSNAVKFVSKEMEQYDLVIFAGSLYLIGEIRGLLINEQKHKEDYSIL